ncbi:MAG: enoyl-CoA hydratase/isomerase family protein [Bryobacteraceae bacterium]
MSLLVDHECRVLRLTLNRPHKRNALNAEMCSKIVEAIAAAQKNQNVGSILISSAGQAFCAGMDLDEAVRPAGADLAEVHETLFTAGANSLKPIVLCVNGPALGGGLGLVAQGHAVIAAESAVFGLTELRLGLWPFLVYRAVEAALGARRTLELSLTARVFTPHDALQWGLVHYVFPQEEASPRAAAIARDLGKASPLAIEAGMRYVRGSRGKSWEEAGELAAALRHKLMNSADFKEGCTAFKEKREPRWPSLYS